jgi:hypothetical protein
VNPEDRRGWLVYVIGVGAIALAIVVWWALAAHGNPTHPTTSTIPATTTSTTVVQDQRRPTRDDHHDDNSVGRADSRRCPTADPVSQGGQTMNTTHIHHGDAEDSDVCVECDELFCPDTLTTVDYDPQSGQYWHRDGTTCFIHQVSHAPEPDDEPVDVDDAVIATALENIVSAIHNDEADILDYLPEAAELVGHITRVESYEQGGWLTIDQGFAIHLDDDTVYTVTVKRAR